MIVDTDFLLRFSENIKYKLIDILSDRVILVESEIGTGISEHFVVIAAWAIGKGARDISVQDIKLSPDSKFHIYDGLEFTVKSTYNV